MPHHHHHRRTRVAYFGFFAFRCVSFRVRDVRVFRVCAFAFDILMVCPAINRNRLCVHTRVVHIKPHREASSGVILNSGATSPRARECKQEIRVDGLKRWPGLGVQQRRRRRCSLFIHLKLVRRTAAAAATYWLL